ncbi:hypothetical protein COI93_03730 [Bacillus cereus]|uniref:Uncharacterized protein n=1 Tax=Bacillus cereus TaxID=1396 RepID=A0A2B0MWW5_BACCE|nr:hypothetical protein COI93_03730 [Bacillus cereus]
MLQNRNRSSNELLLSILSKHGGITVLLKLANVLGIDISRNHINPEHVQNITNQHPDDLLLSILDKPAGLDILIQVTQLADIHVRKEQITVEKYRKLLSSHKSLPPSHTTEISTTSTSSQRILSILEKITSPTIASNLFNIFTKILPLQTLTHLITSSITTSVIHTKQLDALKNFLTKENPTYIEKILQQLLLSTQTHSPLGELFKKNQSQ